MQWSQNSLLAISEVFWMFSLCMFTSDCNIFPHFLEKTGKMIWDVTSLLSFILLVTFTILWKEIRTCIFQETAKVNSQP